MKVKNDDYKKCTHVKPCRILYRCIFIFVTPSQYTLDVASPILQQWTKSVYLPIVVGIDQITAKHHIDCTPTMSFRIPSFLRCSWSILYWFPTGFFLSTHFYHVKTISGRSMQVCNCLFVHRGRGWLTLLKEANAQSQLFSIKRCSCL